MINASTLVKCMKYIHTKRMVVYCSWIAHVIVCLKPLGEQALSVILSTNLAVKEMEVWGKWLRSGFHLFYFTQIYIMYIFAKSVSFHSSKYNSCRDSCYQKWLMIHRMFYVNGISGLVHGCVNYIPNELELIKLCAKQSKYITLDLIIYWWKYTHEVSLSSYFV